MLLQFITQKGGNLGGDIADHDHSEVAQGLLDKFIFLDLIKAAKELLETLLQVELSL